MAKVSAPSSRRKAVQTKSHPSKVAKTTGSRFAAGNSKPKAKNQNERKKVMQDTIKQTPNIVGSTSGALATSTFINKQLAPLERGKCPNLETKPARFLLGDTLAVTRRIMMKDTTDHDNKVAVLNMASDERVGGARGIPSGPTQEDALCYSSTLYETLKAQEQKYPWKRNMEASRDTGAGHNCAAIFSPSVVIFKDSSENDYAMLKDEDRRIVGVISVAAPRGVQLVKSANHPDEKTQDGLSKKSAELREKIRLICRIAADNGRTVLVLGAFGCGKFKCDPRVVAATFYEVLFREEEFRGWFEMIVFAIYTQATLDVFKTAYQKYV